MNPLARVLAEMGGGRLSYREKQSTFSQFCPTHSRVQSPSSINTYYECPRKYYYRYIKALPSKPSIHLLRGKFVHSVLEEMFSLDPSLLSPSAFEFELKVILAERMKTKWQDCVPTMEELGIGAVEQQAYFEESKRMIENFVSHHSARLKRLCPEMGLVEAFKRLTPKREVYLCSKVHRVQGYIDALYEQDEVTIVDYKTSASDNLREEYRRQLAIYALMYFENFHKLPDWVGIHFLLHGLRLMRPDNQMIDEAKRVCQQVHKLTTSTSISSYPRGSNPLCKWGTGECDYYSECWSAGK